MLFVHAHQLIIDFKAAYDTIDQKKLWSIMQRYHFPGKLIRLLGGHHERGAVQGESIELNVGDGLKVTDSPFCSSTSSWKVSFEARGLDNDIRGTILYRSLQLFGFADDIDIIGRTTAKVCDEAYNRLKGEAARIGLRINATKTKYLLAGDSDHLGSSVLIDDGNLKVVKEFCYLGTIVSSNNCRQPISDMSCFTLSSYRARCALPRVMCRTGDRFRAPSWWGMCPTTSYHTPNY